MTTLILQLVLAALLAAQSQAGGMQSQAVASSQGAPAYGTPDGSGSKVARLGEPSLAAHDLRDGMVAVGVSSSGVAPVLRTRGGGDTGSIGQPAQAIKGVATWYDAPSIHDAAAGPALRRALGRDWRGQTVIVTASGGSGAASAPRIAVRLTDWCLCSKGHRVIDLDDRAFRELAPLSRGVVSVTVSWGAEIPLPPTDTAP